MPACFSKYKFTEKLTNFGEDDPAWLLSVAVAATGLSQTWSHVAAAAGESYTCGGTVCPFGGLLLIYVLYESLITPFPHSYQYSRLNKG